MEAAPPPGMWAATGSVTSKAPTLSDIRRGSFSTSGWNEEPQRYKAERRASQSEEGGNWLQRRTSNNQSGNNENESAPRPGLSKSGRTKSSDQLKAQGIEPFPTVSEEDTRDVAHEEDISQAPSYDDPEKDELRKVSDTKKSKEKVRAEPHSEV